MKNFGMFVVALSCALVSGSAMASGFKCGGEGYNVKMFNLTTGATRKPAVLVISHDEASPKTLLTAKGSDIRKHNKVTSVQYVTDGASLDLNKVILQVSFKEGVEVIAEGDIVDGQLILVGEAGQREVIRLACERYLKN